MPYLSSHYGAAAYGELEASLPAGGFERLLLLSPRDSDLATMTASTAVPSLPVSNLRNQEPSNVWRMTSALNQHVDITFPEPVACNAAAMAGYFRFSQLGVWRLTAYASAGDVGGTPVLDSGWQSVWPSGYRHASPVWGPEVALLRVTNGASYRHWRAWFHDPAPGVTYLDVGRLALGVAVQFSINVDPETGIGFVPNDVVEPNGYGQTFTDPRPYAQRAFDLPWTGLAEDEVHAAAMELTRLRGQAGDVFCFLNPAEVANFHRWSMHGLFTGRAQYTARQLWLSGGRRVWGFNFSLIQKL